MISPFKAGFDQESGSWTGLQGSSLALALHAAVKGCDRPVLVLTRSSHQARILEKDLALFNDGKVPVLHFPDRETLPYDPFSAHPDIASERLSSLAALSDMKQGILVLPVSTLLQRLAPRSHVLGNTFDLRLEQVLDISEFRSKLTRAGYVASEQVYQTGQFAVRGSVIDLFPTGAKLPLRIDLFDNEIETIRPFDPESQRSEDRLNT